MTKQQMEKAKDQLASDSAYAAVRSEFHTAGIRFLADDGDSVGLRLRAR